jgi:hypothetical protein
LTEAPQAVGRPLALLQGQAYAAAWPFVRQTTSATDGGEAAARETVRQALWVVRDDGHPWSRRLA